MSETDEIDEAGPPPEYSLPVDLHALPEGGRRYALNPDKAIFANLAIRLKILAVEALEGEILLTAGKLEFTAKGSVKARLVRECVASLEPVDECVDEGFELVFSRQPLADEETMSVEELLGAREVHVERYFDIAELLVQQLSLAMDSFPRKSGAVSLAEKYGTEPETSPFAILRGGLSGDEGAT